MEHEVFVPFPVHTVRQVLADPVCIARCVPGFQQDADESAGPLSGRLRVRIGGHTITYRGTLRVVEDGDSFAVEGEGTEVRGDGSVEMTLTVVPEPAEAGTRLTCSGTVRSKGRLAEFDGETAGAVAQRLLDRFGAGLAARLAAEAAADAGEATTDGPQPPQAAAEEWRADTGEQRAEDVPEGEGEGGRQPEVDGRPSVFDVEVPPPSLGPLADDVEGFDDVEPLDGLDDLEDEPPAEAAHARRTMIGRSTEEVDHAPPRGRYAPVPAPDAMPAGATLRWAAPAAALVLASAVVFGRRVLRRRR